LQLVDVHCHLDEEKLFVNIETVISDAKNSGVAKMISSATKFSNWERTILLAQKYSEIKCTLGIHPWFVASNDFQNLDTLYSFKSKMVAVGEIGLDKACGKNFSLQQKFFEAQLKIAKELNLPVVIHSVRAYNEIIDSVKRVGMKNIPGIIHGFTGSLELAEILISLGFSFSVSKLLLSFMGNKKIKMLQRIYPAFLLLETDSPNGNFFGENKNKYNVPANLIFYLKRLAVILGKTENDIAVNTTKNAEKIFNLGILK